MIFQEHIGFNRLRHRPASKENPYDEHTTNTLLIGNYCESDIHSSLEFLSTVVGHGDVPGSKSNNETRSVFDALSYGIGQESSFL